MEEGDAHCAVELATLADTQTSTWLYVCRCYGAADAEGRAHTSQGSGPCRSEAVLTQQQLQCKPEQQCSSIKKQLQATKRVRAAAASWASQA